MWEFRNRNVFGSTAFSTYGGFWMSLGIFVALVLLSKNVAAAVAGSERRVFGVLLTLQVTEVLLAVGFFREAHGLDHARGRLGRDRHGRGCVVRVGGRGGKRHVTQAGASRPGSPLG